MRATDDLALLRRLVASGATVFVGEAVLLPDEVPAFLAEPLGWKAKAQGVSRRMLELWALTGYSYPVSYCVHWPLRMVAEVLDVVDLGGVTVQHIRLACGHDVLAHLRSNQRRSRCHTCHTIAALETMVRL
jgi:hypothetical protein